MKKFGFDNLLVSDREIFDAIYSQKQKLPDEKLLEICRNYGIFLSNNEDRESICHFISTQVSDWNKLKALLDSINHDEKNAKTTTVKFSGAEFKHFKEAIKEIAPLYEDNHMSHTGKGTSKYEVNLTTSSVELSNTRLIQKPLKDQRIIVEKIGEDVILRYDSEEVLEPIINNIIEKVSGKAKGSLKSKEICLKDIKISDYRTSFFLNLIVLDDQRYQLRDVKKIKVHHNKNNQTMELKEDDFAKDEGFLKSAQLSGTSLHNNELYKGLKKLGHYITEITWHIEDTHDKKLLEINAGFLNVKDCSKFFYDLKCYYKQTAKGDRYTTERQKFKEIEKSKFFKFFDDFTYKVFDNTLDEYNNSLVVNDE
ncbi:hypothetical protein [Acinetobacter pittii]|uniref:hypothetical protein n=1 Tax=Acinetobacter pittii TaxID=48296 RepID=UPI001D08B29E|nr:hypothetical protein [Acinetobacter pittii]